MLMHDINKDKKDVVLLIHPMLASGKGMKTLIADRIDDEYRWLLPDLSGHGEDMQTDYPGAAEEAEAILAYLKENHIEKLKLGFGASLGGVVLLQIIRDPAVSFEHLFFEGTPFFTNSRFLCRIIRRKFIKKHNRAVHNEALCQQKMEAMYGKEIGPYMADNFIHISENSIEHVVHDCGFVDLPSLPEDIQKVCTFAYGSRDFDCSHALKMIPKVYPLARTQVWPDYGHCQKMSSDPDGYAVMLKKYMESD